MSIEVQIPEMMEAGAHFGHQTKRWNPKMRQYIYGARSGVHILNLQRTKDLANEALKIVTDLTAAGKKILFVGTKPQARNAIKDEATRCKQHYVNQRWMGGTLTNFATIKKSIDRLIDLETRRANNDFKGYNKRELLEVDRTILKLEASLGGIKKLNGTPDLVFIIDPKQEHIAVLESRKLGIPVMAITDSNCDPEPIDYVIPANDDALLSIEYFAKKIADACLAGAERFEQHVREHPSDRSDDNRRGGQRRSKRVSKGSEGGKGKTSYVGRSKDANEFEGDAKEGFSAKVEGAAAAEATSEEQKALATG